MLSMMRFSLYFLAFLTLWMSTWMVTEIHDVSVLNRYNSFQESTVQLSTSFAHHEHEEEHEHASHCGICSYDHDGHTGKTLATSSFVAESYSEQNTIRYTLQPNLWYSGNTSPDIRLPIA